MAERLSMTEMVPSAKLCRWVARCCMPPSISDLDGDERARMHLRVMMQAQRWADECGQDYARAADVCGPRGDLFFALKAHRHALCCGVLWWHVAEGCVRAVGGRAALFGEWASNVLTK